MKGVEKLKRLSVLLIALILIVAMSSTVFAGQREYEGKCKNTFDTLTFGHYITALPGEYMDAENYHNFKYSHTSGVPVNFVCVQIFNDYGYYNYDQYSGDYVNYPIRNDSGENVTYHIRITNHYYTGNYMYSYGRYFTY
jgi:hypothetical protein